MKRLITLLALGFVLFSSCRKEVTEVTEVTQVVNQAIGIKYTLKPADWVTKDGGFSFTASVKVPELNDTIYDHGAVVSYISFGTEFYEALPEVFDGVAYGSIHSPGWVSIDYHALDGSKLDAPGGNVNLKIVLIPAKAMQAHPNINLKSFQDVERTFLKN